MLQPAGSCCASGQKLRPCSPWTWVVRPGRQSLEAESVTARDSRFVAESQTTQWEPWWPEIWVSPGRAALAVVLLVELLAEELPCLGR